MLKVIERRSQLEGLAEQLDSGRYKVTFNDGTVRELAESTFKRLFTVLDENPVETAQQESATTVEQSTSNKYDVPNNSETELDALLADAEVVKTDEENENNKQEVSNEAKENKKEKQRSVEDLGLNIELLDWKMTGTRGGKTDKVTSIISIKGYKMEITEYDGYITDVRLFEENTEAPDNDPDAQWKLVYRSPKMSLKDTLQWLGLNTDDMKLARKEITSIRKAVKAAHLEQKKEQEESEVH